MIRTPRTQEPGRIAGLGGLAASVLVHCLAVLIGGWLWVRPVTYGVTAGESSIEVDLIAAPAAAQSKAAPVPTAPAPDPTAEPEPGPAPQPEAFVPADPSSIAGSVGDGSSPVPGPDAVTVRTSAGAQVAARPNYLRNPAPRYPETSRKNNEEGLVMLNVKVSATGRPITVGLVSSSGFERLDRAAMEAVRRWAFEPARLGPVAVASDVQVPVRFRLSDNKGSGGSGRNDG